jgi:hypothetical protein
MILALLIATAAVGPADWACANNLIEKNYSAKFTSGQLAGRIVDECMPDFDRDADPLWKESLADLSAAEAQYTVDKLEFLIDVQEKLEKRRRAAAIPLKR